MKKILLAIALVVIGVVSYHKFFNDQHEQGTNAKSDGVGEAVINSALRVSELDVSALSGITEKLKGACSRNKYGLSENACIQAIEDRKFECSQQTAQQYPGQLSDVNRMQEVASSFVKCIFEK